MRETSASTKRKYREKSKGQENINPIVIQRVIEFLQLFMCETLAKRLIGIVLVAIGLSYSRVAEITGITERSVYTIRNSLADGNLEKLLVVGGGGRKSKLSDIEAEIISEINRNNYRSRQQIADMIKENFGINVSLPAIARLLKKTESSV